MRAKLFLKILFLIIFLSASTTCDNNKQCGFAFAPCAGTGQCCPIAAPYFCTTDQSCNVTHGLAEDHCGNATIVHCE